MTVISKLLSNYKDDYSSKFESRSDDPEFMLSTIRGSVQDDLGELYESVSKLIKIASRAFSYSVNDFNRIGEEFVKQFKQGNGVTDYKGCMISKRPSRKPLLKLDDRDEYKLSLIYRGSGSYLFNIRLATNIYGDISELQVEVPGRIRPQVIGELKDIPSRVVDELGELVSSMLLAYHLSENDKYDINDFIKRYIQSGIEAVTTEAQSKANELMNYSDVTRSLFSKFGF